GGAPRPGAKSSAPSVPPTAAPEAGAAAGSGTTAGGGTAGSGTVYREERLAAQVQRLVAGAGAQPSAGPPVEVEPGLSGGSCPAPAGGSPLATDRGTFAGAPAEVWVYAVPGRPDQLDVYLRSPGCGPLLLHRTVPAR
ncbi:hypothetical protein ACWEQL_37790, partial [Kitasatospora sp. NPDC004240]